MKRLSVLFLLLCAHQCLSMGKYQRLSGYENNKEKQKSEKIIDAKPTYIVKNSLGKSVQLIFYRNGFLKTIMAMEPRNVINVYTHYPEDPAKIEIYNPGARNPECIATFKLTTPGAFEFFCANTEEKSLGLRPLSVNKTH